MKEQFTRVMVQCAAITVFGTGAYTAYSGVGAINESSVRAVLTKEIARADAAAQAEESASSGVGATLQSLKKLGRLLN